MKIVDTSRCPKALYRALSIVAGRDAEPARGRAVEVDVGLQAAVLEIAGDIGELRHLLQPVGELVNPLAQFVRIDRLDRELVLRAADAVLDRQVLHRLHEQRDAIDLRQLGLQAPDDLSSR